MLIFQHFKDYIEYYYTNLYEYSAE